MMRLTSDCSLLPGEPLTLEASVEAARDYRQVQVDVLTCAVDNPCTVLSSGTAPTLLPDGTISLSLPTRDLAPGVYEIGRLSLHTPVSEMTTPEQVRFFRGKHFVRLLFEIRESGAPRRQELAAYVAARETELEDRFLSGLDVRQDARGGRAYCVLCFVKGLLLTGRMRFDRWEVQPFRGLDAEDHINAINDFLKGRTSFSTHFDYSDRLRAQSRNQSPLCVVHFPMVFAQSEDVAAHFCIAKPSLLTEALSYYRHASGIVFAAVPLDRETGTSNLFTRPEPYRGNLLGGMIAGEDPDTVRLLVEQLDRDPQLRYFLSLYKQARAETNVDYAYLRNWLILESVAESKGFAHTEVLIDPSGLPLPDKKGKPRKAGNALGTVYLLLSRSLAGALPSYPPEQPGRQYRLIDFVECWSAMRDAAAHYGGFRSGDTVQHTRFRGYDRCSKVVADQGGLDGFILAHLSNTVDAIVGEEVQSRCRLGSPRVGPGRER